MAVGNGDVIKITTKARYQNQDAFNVFWYVIDNLVVGLTLLDIVLEFRDVVMDVMRDLQLSQLEYSEIVGDNMTNEVDTETVLYIAPGTDAGGGQQGASYVALGFGLTVSDKRTRPGGKRLGGIGEDRVLGNLQDADQLKMDAFSNAVLATLSVSGIPAGSGLAIPSIVKRSTLGLGVGIVHQPITGITQEVTIRSQVSRRAST